ncbi:MAG: hypothetical protein O7C75_16375, partial [Verrucomicrobia bacterium]|nr:hypothetical protein [Verrucomicrobiota bacterium]
MKKLFLIFLILLGIGLIVIGFAADFLGIGGDPGIGTKQILLSMIGIAALMIGIVQRFSLDWRGVFSGPSVTPAQLLHMAICFGLLTGLLEGLMLIARKW